VPLLRLGVWGRGTRYGSAAAVFTVLYALCVLVGGVKGVCQHIWAGGYCVMRNARCSCVSGLLFVCVWSDKPVFCVICCCFKGPKN
jgi:hypothetical protein